MAYPKKLAEIGPICEVNKQKKKNKLGLVLQLWKLVSDDMDPSATTSGLHIQSQRQDLDSGL